jgi:hypothetical protein
MFSNNMMNPYNNINNNMNNNMKNNVINGNQQAYYPYFQQNYNYLNLTQHQPNLTQNQPYFNQNQYIGLDTFNNKYNFTFNNNYDIDHTNNQFPINQMNFNNQKYIIFNKNSKKLYQYGSSGENLSSFSNGNTTSDTNFHSTFKFLIIGVSVKNNMTKMTSFPEENLYQDLLSKNKDSRSNSENLQNFFKQKSLNQSKQDSFSDKFCFSEIESSQEDIEHLINSLNANLIEFIKSQRGSR